MPGHQAVAPGQHHKSNEGNETKEEPVPPRPQSVSEAIDAKRPRSLEAFNFSWSLDVVLSPCTSQAADVLDRGQSQFHALLQATHPVSSYRQLGPFFVFEVYLSDNELRRISRRSRGSSRTPNATGFRTAPKRGHKPKSDCRTCARRRIQRRGSRHPDSPPAKPPGPIPSSRVTRAGATY